jgi:hypothetical protein
MILHRIKYRPGNIRYAWNTIWEIARVLAKGIKRRRNIIVKSRRSGKLSKGILNPPCIILKVA